MYKNITMNLNHNIIFSFVLQLTINKLSLIID